MPPSLRFPATQSAIEAPSIVGERFHAPGPPQGGQLRLSSGEAHHLTRVLRAGPGAQVECFDGEGRAWIARVASIAKDVVILDVLAELPRTPDPPISLTVATAFPKGDRADWLIEKATEIGVNRLVPLRTARSVVDPSPSKLDRLRQRVIEACKQSGRNTLMRIDGLMQWDDFLDQENLENREGWIACPGVVGRTAGEAPRAAEAILAIGPEGGFEPAEVVRAEAIGWRPIGLGPHVLRVETAGLVGSSLLLHRGVEGPGTA